MSLRTLTFRHDDSTDHVGVRFAHPNLRADIEIAANSGRMEAWVVTTHPDGSTIVEVLDALGKPKPIDTSRILIPGTNLSGAQP
jgi:hypothetical protein